MPRASIATAILFAPSWMEGWEMRRSVLLAAAVAAAAVGSAFAENLRDPQRLVRLWQEENEKCRGGPGDDPTTEAACAARGVYQDELAAQGWCYGRKGEAGYQMRWHKCTKNSLR
jgi:hypothetical protein